MATPVNPERDDASPAPAGAIVTRFAPSPTGRLHLGHLWSALQAYDLARAAGGRFLLRIEDIDPGRCRASHVAAIQHDLVWLGLGWDGPIWHQSARMAAYADALTRLRAMGLLYPCFCTRADIAAATTAPHGPAGALYPGTCRQLDPAAARDRIERGDAHCWRIDMARAVAVAGPIGWHDAYRGAVAADPLSLGDVVLARKDVPTAYHLAVTIDDAAQGVTDIVRGVDLFEATHVHRLLQALLGLPVPRWHHHGLLTDAGGERLAKRHGASSVDALKHAGWTGPALADALRSGCFPIGIGVIPA